MTPRSGINSTFLWNSRPKRFQSDCSAQWKRSWTQINQIICVLRKRIAPPISRKLHKHPYRKLLHNKFCTQFYMLYKRKFTCMYVLHYISFGAYYRTKSVYFWSYRNDRNALHWFVPTTNQLISMPWKYFFHETNDLTPQTSQTIVVNCISDHCKVEN